MTDALLLLAAAGLACLAYYFRRSGYTFPAAARFGSARVRNGLAYMPLGLFAVLIAGTLLTGEPNPAYQPVLAAAAIFCMLLLILTRNLLLSVALGLLVVFLAGFHGPIV